MLDQITADLNNLRSNSNNELTYYYIFGNPGSGKSQLARKICKETFNSIDSKIKTTFVMTFEGKDASSLLKTYVELCQLLNNDKTVIDNILLEAESSEHKIKNFQVLLTPNMKFWQGWRIIVHNVVDLHKILSITTSTW